MRYENDLKWRTEQLRILGIWWAAELYSIKTSNPLMNIFFIYHLCEILLRTQVSK